MNVGNGVERRRRKRRNSGDGETKEWRSVGKREEERKETEMERWGCWRSVVQKDMMAHSKPCRGPSPPHKKFRPSEARPAPLPNPRVTMGECVQYVPP